MPEIWNPVQVEERLRQLANRIAKSAAICDARYRAYLAAELTYEQAWHHAYLAASDDGPAHRAKSEAIVSTKAEKEALDLADAAYRYADRLAKSLDAELRAYQSIGASIRQAYATAGTGEH